MFPDGRFMMIEKRQGLFVLDLERFEESKKQAARPGHTGARKAGQRH